MTTATRRLRRGGVAGLAVSLTAGVAIFATATSAFAALGTVTNQVDTTTGATTVYPGTTAQAVGSDDINLTNAFNIGDTFTVALAKAPGCGTTSGAVGFATTPTVTATGPFQGTFGSGAASTDASTAVLPTFTVATQSSTGACTTAGIKDQLLITFTNSSAGAAGDNFELVIGGQSVNVGSAVTPGAITETTTPSNGTAPAAVTIATVANTKATEATTTAALTGAAQTDAVASITLSDVGSAAIIAPPIYLTLAPGTGAFTSTATPIVTGPTGSTWTTTLVSATELKFAAGGTALPTTNNTFTVSGVQLTVPNTVATYTITASFGAAYPGTTIGGALTALVVSNQARLGGVDRYSSSAQLFNSQFSSANCVVLASGANFPDALSATYLAKTLGPTNSSCTGSTGVLLTDPNVLQQSTSLVLTNGHIAFVYIVGGTAAVSSNVQNAISGLHVGNNPGTLSLLTVVRVAGADRYATNNAVDLYAGGSVSGGTAILASGQNYPDALAVGPAVYNKGYALILTNTASLNSNAVNTLTNLGIHSVVIVGGTSAVAAAVESAVHTSVPAASVIYRIAGADRTLTASQIATWETQGLPATTTYTTALASLGFSYTTTSTAYLADGANFPDALSAGAVAGAQARVILLTADPNTLGAGAAAYLSTAGLAHVSGIIAVGLAAAVSVATYNAAVAAL